VVYLGIAVLTGGKVVQHVAGISCWKPGIVVRTVLVVVDVTGGGVGLAGSSGPSMVPLPHLATPAA